MRDIADIHERISKAFSSSAAADIAEPVAEQVVPALGLRQGEEGKAPRNAFASLFSRISEWRRQRTVPRLQHALKNAEAASAAKSRQIATVVHEIRTPLNGILGMSHLLGQTKLTAEQQNYLSGIRQSGYALVQLVEDLLDYSTLEAGRFRLNNRAENLRHLIENVVEMLAPRAHEKRIEIAATMAADLPDLLDFDPGRIRQVLFNVIGNAVKFTAHGGVLVRALVEEGNVSIAVIDTGPGMASEELARVFGEFEQAGSAEARSGGTGLGLGIASRILTEFGGSLSVTSQKGAGSTFTIRFPLRFAETAQSGAGERGQLLAMSRVLLLAPEGPAAKATVATIETLGGRCRHIANTADAQVLIDRAEAGPMPYTDLIVDHRLASNYANEKAHAPVHRILLVNPEERASQPQDFFDAWLIRPLREKSLIDVLSGRLRGFGTRDALNDNQAMPPPPVIEKHPEGLDVLLGEDDPVNALIIRSVLTKAGHRVRLIEDFPTLIKAALDRDMPLDLIISDMHMPGGDVFSLLAALRADEENGVRSPVPVIVLTGESREATHREALLNGASRVLAKPADPLALLEEVRILGVLSAERQQAR
ncbi:signal transduction histidine kinase/CheY-like chemotaxis protein [Neorhizobium sp. 2083]|uniref:hybrid sensor histidine kinase/response regulator n=1 Tax=Neorhizobium sp. 2083 TaxID=2817762 RepID=UPI0028570C8D|nr:ATP-binding protein [Neorhizobium sp. 2083]MDR6815980.1 signal transduction histidine kinase/CheY-like chemotaxis protein [Neorhizobium sp. 2083]